MAYEHQRVQHDAENARRYLEQAIPQLRDPLEVRNLSFAVEFFVEGNMPYLAMVLAETAKEELRDYACMTVQYKYGAHIRKWIWR